MDGKEICAHIRRHPVHLRFQFFSTARDEEKDEIEGLELERMTTLKPAGLHLIKAHVESQLRRMQPEKSNGCVMTMFI